MCALVSSLMSLAQILNTTVQLLARDTCTSQHWPDRKTNQQMASTKTNCVKNRTKQP